jgi:hypothetical protein
MLSSPTTVRQPPFLLNLQGAQQQTYSLLVSEVRGG